VFSDKPLKATSLSFYTTGAILDAKPTMSKHSSKRLCECACWYMHSFRN